MPALVNPTFMSRGDSRGCTATCAMICADCDASASGRLTIGTRLSSATWWVRLKRLRTLLRLPLNRIPSFTGAALENWSMGERYGQGWGSGWDGTADGCDVSAPRACARRLRVGVRQEENVCCICSRARYACGVGKPGEILAA